ncbi:MAG: hypothetical protein QXI58_01270 [Candidatus Micrarchaeia archaeon]
MKIKQVGWSAAKDWPVITTKRKLNNLWKTAGKDPYRFITLADRNGFGLISVKKFLEEKGIFMTEEEIDKIRCPYLYDV